jgi:fibronectin-binding autotransporter adhesin
MTRAIRETKPQSRPLRQKDEGRILAAQWKLSHSADQPIVFSGHKSKKSIPKSIMKNRVNPLLTALVFIGLPTITKADTYNWNGSTTGGLTGVSDTWDTATANWTGFGTTWPTTPSTNDDAVFGGTGGIVPITTSVTANDITLAQTSGASYRIGADNTLGAITLNGSSPIISSSGTISSNTIGAIISGSAGLTKAGNRTLELRGACNYTGDTRVLNGNLLIGLASNRLPTATTLILGNATGNTNGVFQMNSRSQQVAGIATAGTGTGNRVMNSNATISTFTVANTTDQTFTGILGGATTNDNNFNFTKSAAGRLVLASSNTFTGTTTVSGGTLELGHATNTLADAAPVNINAGTLDIADKTETIGALTVTSGSITGTTGVLSAPSCAGKAGTVSAILAGTTNLSGTNTTWLTKDTAGNLTLSAANTFTGNIVITLGRLTLANSAALGVADPAPGGTNRKGLVMQGGDRSLWLKGGITLPSNIDIFASSNSGDGGGINNESGNNEIQCPITFSVGLPALNISSTSGKLTVSGNITMTQTTRTLYLGGASLDDNTISGNITESTVNIMPIIKQGAGKWILSGSNTYKGDTTVNGGTLVLASGGSQKFYPKSDASSNKITGNGSAVTLNGAFDIDLTAAALSANGTSWLLVDVDNVAETFDTIFTVSSFAEGPAGTWTKTEGGSLYTFTENDGRLVKSAAASTYATWLTANSPATGFITDSDNDGVANGVENVLGTNPNVYSAGLTNISATASTATYKHTLNPTVASNVSYSYEWSTDMTEWKASGASNTGGTIATITPSTPSTPVSGVVTVTTTANAPTARLFTRIKASIP